MLGPRHATGRSPPPGAPIASDRIGRAGRPLIDDAFLQDPYPTYAALRDAGRVLWSDDFFGGAWLVSHHADVEHVLRDAAFSARRTGGWVMGVGGMAGMTGASDAATVAAERDALASRLRTQRAALRPFQRLFARAMLFLDAPDHLRVRQTMAAAFRPADLQRLAPRIAQAVTERLDALDGPHAHSGATAGAGAATRAGADERASGRANGGDGSTTSADVFDFVATVARPLPAQVIGMLLGVDDEADFGVWSDDLADFIGAPKPTMDEALRAQSALQSLAATFDRQIRERHMRAPARDEPSPSPADTDLLGRLISAERQGHLRGSAELLSQCAMLLFAGHETTRHLLGNGLRHLLSDTPTLQRLRAQPERIPDAVRELLRFDSPVQYSGRRVVADTVLHGQTLRRGDLVVALIGSANRDPARFADPDRFDIDRRTGTSLAFGQGPHVCIGAALTLMEAKETLSQVLTRWPDLRLDDVATPAWTRNALYRGVTSLPLRFDRLPNAELTAPTLASPLFLDR